MTTISQVIRSIQLRPEGETASNVCQWMAENIMHWTLDPEAGWYLIPFDVFVQLEYDQGVFNCGAGCVMLMDDWNPFTNSNHTRLLVQKSGVVWSDRTKKYLLDAGEGCVHHYPLKPYDLDKTHDACQVLRRSYKLGYFDPRSFSFDT